MLESLLSSGATLRRRLYRGRDRDRTRDTHAARPRSLNVGSRANYLRRHARMVLPYLTPRKVANLVLNEVELRLARPRPRSIPPYIKIESTPLCHLRCPGCAHGNSDYKKTLNGTMHMSIEHIARIVDPVARELIGVSLSYSGEPLLNRRLPDIVAYLHQRRICTSFPTNLSMRMRDADAERLVRSGLDLMLISLDGASVETYRKYRIGGNFQLVVDNVRKLADAKLRLGSKRPFLVWKMVVFPHNEHEVDVAKRTWASLGFDGCEFVLDYEGAEHLAVEAKVKREMVAGRKPCFWAWNTTVIGWDGSVEPCCKQINEIHLGNALDDGLAAVWRGDAYARLRGGFARATYGESMHPVCQRCLGISEDSVPSSTERRKPIPLRVTSTGGPAVSDAAR